MPCKGTREVSLDPHLAIPPHSPRPRAGGCFDFLRRVVQRCTLSPISFKVLINDLTIAKHGTNVGGDTVTGLTFADGSVGISETPGGLQKQTIKALQYTRERRVAGNENKCLWIVACDHDKGDPIEGNAPIK